MRKLTASLLSVVLSLGLALPCMAQEAADEKVYAGGIAAAEKSENAVSVKATYGDYEYEIVDGSVVINGYYGTEEEPVIPTEIEGYPVFAIASYAFAYNEYITSLTIPEGITAIDKNAVAYLSYLRKLSLPKSLINIEQGAFAGNFKLEEITLNSENTNFTVKDGVLFSQYESVLLSYPAGRSAVEYTVPDGVEIVAASAFEGAEFLEKVTFPETLIKIGNDAFYNTRVSEVNLPESVVSIGEYAFYATSIKEITIGKNVESIGDYAFCDCQKLERLDVNAENANYSSEDGILFDKNKTVLMAYPSGKIGAEYTVPESVTVLYYGSFGGNSQLANVVLHDGITAIDGWAFDGSNIASIDIPASVDMIGEDVFRYCENLMSINVDDANQYYCDVDGVLYSKDMTTLLVYPGGKTEKVYNVLNGVETIGYDAFVYTKVEYVVLPDSVKTIEWAAFDSSEFLAGVYIPESVEFIEDWVFAGRDDFAIYGVAGSYAQTYADKSTIPFIEGMFNIEGTDTPNEGEILVGDVNGDGKINSRDIAAIQKFLTGSTELSEEEMLFADSTGDGKVNSRDIAALQKKILS